MSLQKLADLLTPAPVPGTDYAKKLFQPKPVVAGSVAPRIPGGNLQPSKPVMATAVRATAMKSNSPTATTGPRLKTAAVVKLLQIYKQAATVKPAIKLQSILTTRRLTHS